MNFFFSLSAVNCYSFFLLGSSYPKPIWNLNSRKVADIQMRFSCEDCCSCWWCFHLCHTLFSSADFPKLNHLRALHLCGPIKCLFWHCHDGTFANAFPSEMTLNVYTSFSTSQLIINHMTHSSASNCFFFQFWVSPGIFLCLPIGDGGTEITRNWIWNPCDYYLLIQKKAKKKHRIRLII